MKDWTCKATISVSGTKTSGKYQETPCGFRCSTETSGADNARINHLTDHNPTPAQWTEAYNRIQSGKERAKEREKKATA
jgi:hypothetical protein